MTDSGIPKPYKGGRVLNNLPTYICCGRSNGLFQCLFAEALFTKESQIDLLILAEGIEMPLTYEPDNSEYDYISKAYISLLLYGHMHVKFLILGPKDEQTPMKNGCDEVCNMLTEFCKKNDLPIPELKHKVYADVVDELGLFKTINYRLYTETIGFHLMERDRVFRPTIPRPWYKLSCRGKEIMPPLMPSPDGIEEKILYTLFE